MASAVAIVTGASRGIGEAIARRLSKDGFNIALIDLPSQKPALEALHREISISGRRVYIHTADVSKESQVKKMIGDTIQTLGGLHVMVANAGILRPTRSDVLGTVDDWDQVMSLNARGVYLCYKYAAEIMIAQGRGGRIIGAASIASKQGVGFAPSYSASKFAVRGLTQSAELGKYGITVNAYAPGPIETPMLQTFGLNLDEQETFNRREAEKTAVGRIGKPEEVQPRSPCIVLSISRFRFHHGTNNIH
ncbi:hypothetical protein Ac2012v2_007085 [Leucoagaricus gongylophorus]